MEENDITYGILWIKSTGSICDDDRLDPKQPKYSDWKRHILDVMPFVVAWAVSQPLWLGVALSLSFSRLRTVFCPPSI